MSSFFTSGEWDVYPTIAKPKMKETTQEAMEEAPKETASSDIISVMNDYALVKDRPPPKFVGIDNLVEKVKVRQKEMEQGRSQYLTFSQVKPNDYHSIQKYRDENGPKFLLTYFSPIKTLVVKIPNGPQEQIHRNFGALLRDIVRDMGLRGSELYETGSQTYRSNHNPPSQFFSEKEGDSTYRNRALRPNNDKDWPHLVIEAGDSESLPRLQADAKWWIENSKSQVRIVLILKIDTKKRTIRILKYISVQPPSSSRYSLRHHSDSVPSLSADIVMDHSVSPAKIQGTPLTLEFDRIFGRSPNPPLESNSVLTTQCLNDWAIEYIW